MKLIIDSKEYLIENADNSIYFNDNDFENAKKRLTVIFSEEEEVTLDDLILLRGKESPFELLLDDSTTVLFNNYQISSIRKSFNLDKRLTIEFIGN